MLTYNIIFKELEMDFTKIDPYDFNTSELEEAGYILERVNYGYISFYDQDFKNEIVIYPNLSYDIDKGVSPQGVEAAKIFIERMKEDKEKRLPGFVKEIKETYLYLQKEGLASEDIEEHTKKTAVKSFVVAITPEFKLIECSNCKQVTYNHLSQVESCNYCANCGAEFEWDKRQRRRVK